MSPASGATGKPALTVIEVDEFVLMKRLTPRLAPLVPTSVKLRVASVVPEAKARLTMPVVGTLVTVGTPVAVIDCTVTVVVGVS